MVPLPELEGEEQFQVEVNAGGGGIFPDFLHNLTGILSAKHQIQILANKMQEFAM